MKRESLCKCLILCSMFNDRFWGYTRQKQIRADKPSYFCLLSLKSSHRGVHVHAFDSTHGRIPSATLLRRILCRSFCPLRPFGFNSYPMNESIDDKEHKDYYGYSYCCIHVGEVAALFVNGKFVGKSAVNFGVAEKRRRNAGKGFLWRTGTKGLQSNFGIWACCNYGN